MTTETCWLLWDGVYTGDGICNQPLTPIKDVPLNRFVNGSEEVLNLQMRLRWLGFYRGPLDAQLGSVQRAINEFMVYPRASFTAQDKQHPRLQNVAEVRPQNLPLSAELIARLDSMTGPNLLIPGKQPSVPDTATPDGAPDMAVKIVSVSGDFRPFEQCGGIQIQLTNAQKVRSLMLRIYREGADEDDSTNEPSLKRLVYQEVLDERAIWALPNSAPGPDNVGTYASAPAALMREKRRHATLSLMELHGPYKVVIYISPFANAFAGAAALFSQAWQAVDDALMAGDFEIRDLVDRLGLSHTTPTARRTLGRITDQAQQSPFWTGADMLGVNLIKPPSPQCVDDRSKPYLLQPEIITSLADNPLKVYDDLMKHGKYNLPDRLGGFYDNAASNIRRLLNDLMYGRDAWIDESDRVTLIQALEELRGEFLGLSIQIERRNYQRLMLACRKYVVIYDYLVFVARMVPEYKFYQMYTLELATGSVTGPSGSARFKGSDRSRWMAIRRGKPSPELIEDYPSLHHAFDRYQFLPADTFREDELIILPTFCPLDYLFFVRTRCVPIFIVGLADRAYSNADNNMYTPVEFFKHDLNFHTFGSPSLWESMKQWREELITFLLPSNGHVDRKKLRRDIYEMWHENIQVLLTHRDRLASADDKTAFDVVLFVLAHEPIGDHIVKNPYVNIPSLIDISSLKRRLDDDALMAHLQKKAALGAYGQLSQGALAALPAAISAIRGALGSFPDIAMVEFNNRAVRV